MKTNNELYQIWIQATNDRLNFYDQVKEWNKKEVDTYAGLDRKATEAFYNYQAAVHNTTPELAADKHCNQVNSRFD